MSAAPSTHEEQARIFVAAVRARLSDLPVEEIDDLTDGLAADLVDRLGDGNDLGDAARYADELRQAAGLPERTEDANDTAPSPRRGLRERGSEFAVKWNAWWDATGTRAGLRDFILSLRPVWWVARGVAVGAVIALVFGVRSLNTALVLIALAATILSVQWGRGKWLPGAWAVWLRRIGSVVAILALLPLSANALGRLSYGYADVDSEATVSPGLSLGWDQVTNIFAYDCAGEPLGPVQLFTQDGRPLHTGDGDPGSYGDWTPMSGTSKDGYYVEYRRNSAATMPDEWNVFPLRELQEPTGMPSENVEPETLTERSGDAAELPYERVRGLANCDADAKDADAKGADAEGADAEGADTKDADAKSADAKSADAEDADATDGDAKKTTDTEATDAKPKDAP